MCNAMDIVRRAAALATGILLVAGCQTDMGNMLPPSAYGNGTAGAKVVSTDENWNSAEGYPGNLQFIDLTINAGVTLTLPSGITLRCTGAFTNNGTIIVLPGVEGGFAGQTGSGGDFSSEAVPPGAGIGTLAAQAGESGDDNSARLGGRGGFGISEFEARQILAVAVPGGGGGATAGSDSSSGVTEISGSAGGGAVRILAAGSIVNGAGAAIRADGGEGRGGGGGGGVVILASSTEVRNEGTVSATGGDGEDGDSNQAPSGGGGGGLVHLLAPTISAGTLSVGGGSPGAIGPGVSAVARFGGGGGGPGAGAGGDGGDVPAGGFSEPTAATAGSDGFGISTVVDPEAMF